MMGAHPRQPLRCAECGTTAEGRAEGWKAYVGRRDEDEAVEVFVFCPPCAYREFEHNADDG